MCANVARFQAHLPYFSSGWRLCEYVVMVSVGSQILFNLWQYFKLQIQISIPYILYFIGGDIHTLVTLEYLR